MTTISHEKALEKLIGGLWHTTHPDRFEKIIETGAIMPEPDGIPEEKRWSTARGPDLYPYVRKLGGVSLFDFQCFNYTAYDKKCPNSNWREFVPFRKIWGCAVWVELDRTKTAKSLIQGSDLLKLQEKDHAYRNKIMPHIEVAHLGDLSCDTFVRILQIQNDDKDFQDVSRNFNLA